MKSQKYKRNVKGTNIENRYALLCEKFKLYGNKIKRNTFGGKGRYLIPAIIIKSNYSNDYIITISIKHNLLEKNKDYYAEFFLLKFCD